MRLAPVFGLALALLCAGPAAADFASFYYQPQGLACSDRRFNPQAMTAAHRTLRCGTVVRVTNKRNGRQVVVEINDRGPSRWTGMTIDVSLAAARQLGMVSAGQVPVTIERLR